MSYYAKYIKYKQKYLDLINLYGGGTSYTICQQINNYYDEINKKIKINNLLIQPHFKFLDNYHEALHEGLDFLENIQYNVNYLHESIRAAYSANYDMIPKIPKWTEIAIVSIGSYSTHAYRLHNIYDKIKVKQQQQIIRETKWNKQYIEKKKGVLKSVGSVEVIDLGIGAWYGVKNKDKKKNLQELYNKLNNLDDQIKLIIVHMNGTFGFTPIESSNILIPIDSIPDNLKSNNSSDGSIVLNDLMELIKSTKKWSTVGNVENFKAKWYDNVANNYFRIRDKKHLFIMIFDESNSIFIKYWKENNNINKEILLEDEYNGTLKPINKRNKINIMYDGDFINKISEIINKNIMNRNNIIDVYIYQNGLYREWAIDCTNNKIITDSNKNIF